MTVKVGIEIPEELHQRVKIEAARRKIKMKDACQEAFEAWLKTRDTKQSAEFQEQMRIARQGMERYRNTLRELSR